MSDLYSPPIIILPEGFDEQQEAETPARGYLSHVLVEVESHKYPVYFVDPGRMQQDLLEYIKLGAPYFAEPGLIILPVVTIEAINEAVQRLWHQGFFAHLKPLDIQPPA